MRNLQILAIDLFKVSRDLAPTIYSELLKKSIQFNLQHAAQFSGSNVRSTFHGEANTTLS